MGRPETLNPDRMVWHDRGWGFQVLWKPRPVRRHGIPAYHTIDLKPVGMVWYVHTIPYHPIKDLMVWYPYTLYHTINLKLSTPIAAVTPNGRRLPQNHWNATSHSHTRLTGGGRFGITPRARQSREYGTNKADKTRFWPWLSDRSPLNVLRCSFSGTRTWVL